MQTDDDKPVDNVTRGLLLRLLGYSDHVDVEERYGVDSDQLDRDITATQALLDAEPAERDGRLALPWMVNRLQSRIEICDSDEESVLSMLRCEHNELVAEAIVEAMNKDAEPAGPSERELLDLLKTSGVALSKELDGQWLADFVSDVFVADDPIAALRAAWGEAHREAGE